MHCCDRRVDGVLTYCTAEAPLLNRIMSACRTSAEERWAFIGDVLQFSCHESAGRRKARHCASISGVYSLARPTQKLCLRPRMLVKVCDSAARCSCFGLLLSDIVVCDAEPCSLKMKNVSFALHPDRTSAPLTWHHHVWRHRYAPHSSQTNMDFKVTDKPTCLLNIHFNNFTGNSTSTSCASGLRATAA